MSDIWGTDTKPSMPEPIGDRPAVVDFGGFVFTTGGMAHGISQDEVEEMAMPSFAPSDSNFRGGGEG